MNINFEYYKIFYIIAKNKNITKAANELNISQPAISRILKTMEEQMNIKLFIRKSNGVILTPEGNELYSLISNEINNIIKAEVDFNKVIKNNNIKIAINPNILNYFINYNKMDTLFDKNTNINFINIDKYDFLNNQLTNNLIDFAIVIEPTNYEFNNDIKYKEIDKLHLTFVSTNKNINNNYSLIIQDQNNKLGKLTSNYIKNLNFKFNKIISVDSYDNFLSLIKKENTCGFALKETIANELENKKLYEIDFSIELPNLKIGILYNKNNELKIKSLFNQ